MYDLIYQLELSLLTSSIRKSANQFDRLLAKEFIEFSSSGKIYNKQDVIRTLPLEEGFGSYLIQDFNLIILSSTIMLARYEAIIDGITSLRSSIWKSNGDK